MPFLDITVIPVLTADKAAYLEHSRKTTLIFMEHGHIAVDGPPAELLDQPSNPRLREFLQHVE